MARIYPLFSSSKGNATFIGTPSGGILIDAGVSAKRLRDALSRAGIPAEAVEAVFVTHDHSDHVSGLRVFCRQTGAPVYAEPQTLENLLRCGYVDPDADVHPLTVPVTACGLIVSPFATSHDTEKSCGYRITFPDGQSCAVCTDLGYAPESVQQALCGCRLVLLEANYDDTMLRYGPYPEYLKARIRSNSGHLSNVQSGQLARFLIESGTVHLVLGHLSEHNNTPEKAEQAVIGALGGYVRGQDYLLDIAKPEDGRMIVF
ncbi:MAG: MBL fold metallo-hydrolase [Oscillospiraceae bacterium]|nr:MBL fold metallo-hydrolase [Oscillospiraceae bacterium]